MVNERLTGGCGLGATGDRVSLLVFNAAERTSEAADGNGNGGALRQL